MTSSTSTGQIRSRRFRAARNQEQLLLGRGLAEVGDQVSTLLLLLQPSEDHLGARNVLLGVGKVDVQGVLSPGDTLEVEG